MNQKALDLKSVWQPAGADPTQGSLLVVLHGRGDSPRGFESFQNELALPGLSVLLLQAPDPYYDGFSWYDLPPDQLPGIQRSRALLENVFNELAGQGFAPARTILFGFSQGCLMTLEFGARMLAPLAGYIGVSGYCFDESLLLIEANPVVLKGNWLITHGTQDDVLPAHRTRAQINQLIKGGFNIDYREYDKGHTIDPRKELGHLRECITTWSARG